MKKHDILENIFVEKLIFGGKGLAKAEDGKKIIITGGVIPESVVNLRVLKIRNSYIEAQMLDEVKKSRLEEKLPDHFQVYGGCKWLPIKYSTQLEIKENQVKEALYHLKDLTQETNFHPIVASPDIYGYRNKVEFSFGKYISAKENIRDEFRFGFHKQGEFDRIINCDYCVLADDEINEIFKDVDKFSRISGLPTYDPVTHIGFWRHFVVRKAYYTGEIMLIFSVNSTLTPALSPADGKRENIFNFTKELVQKFKNISSIYWLSNTGKADIVTGEYELLYGNKTIKEKLFDFEFEVNPKSFFQTNSRGAEVLYKQVLDLISISSPGLKGVALDLYAGTGTIGIIMSKYFQKVYSVELVKESSLDGEKNAKLNNISNIEFVNTKVEDFLADFKPGLEIDLLIIDPPRDGMHPDALPNIIKFNSKEIIYVSCNPSTLARDLDYIVKNSNYKITDVVPVDMFPHTHHIETIVKLELKNVV